VVKHIGHLSQCRLIILLEIFSLDTLAIFIYPSLISSFLFAFRFPVIKFENFCLTVNQGCGVGAGDVRSRRFLGGVGFLTTLGVGVGFICPTPIPDAQLDNFLHHTPKLGIPVEMVQFLLKLLLKQRFIAVHHDFH